MTLDDVDLKRDTITVNGKTGRRTIPFGAKTGAALERYIRLRAKAAHADDESLWLGPEGGPTPSGIEQMLNRRSRAAGLGRINPHRLRHTSASRWLEGGGEEGDAVHLFGWADATMLHKRLRPVCCHRATSSRRFPSAAAYEPTMVAVKVTFRLAPWRRASSPTSYMTPVVSTVLRNNTAPS